MSNLDENSFDSEESRKLRLIGMDWGFEQSIIATFGIINSREAKIKVIGELCHKMGISFDVDNEKILSEN